MNEQIKDLVSNRRATHNYEVLETFEAGIVLTGTEIKSLRDNGGNLTDAYVTVTAGEIQLLNSSISPYRFGNIHNHEDKRPRKLLMHKREILKLKTAVQEKGLTLIPLSFYLKKGRVKVKVAIAKGKKNIDKRESLKEKDDQRRMQRALREHE